MKKDSPRKAKGTAAKKTAKKSAAPKEKKEKAVPRISTFTDVPKIASNREYSHAYPFSTLEPGQRIVIDATTEDEVTKARANLYGAFYRFMKSNVEARKWKRAIRVGNDDSGSPINVGFYRLS